MPRLRGPDWQARAMRRSDPLEKLGPIFHEGTGDFVEPGDARNAVTKSIECLPQQHDPRVIADHLRLTTMIVRAPVTPLWAP